MLMPKKEGMKLNYQQFVEICVNEGKLEMADGEIFFSDSDRMTVIMGLIANIGLEKFVHLMPDKVKIELSEILRNKMS